MESGCAASGRKGRKRQGWRVGKAERGTAREKFPCEWMKAGRSRRGEAGLSEERKPKEAEGQETMREEAERCGRLPG